MILSTQEDAYLDLLDEKEDCIKMLMLMEMDASRLRAEVARLSKGIRQRDQIMCIIREAATEKDQRLLIDAYEILRKNQNQ